MHYLEVWFKRVFVIKFFDDIDCFFDCVNDVEDVEVAFAYHSFF